MGTLSKKKKTETVVSLRPLDKILMNISANSKPYAKQLHPVNESPTRDCLGEKKVENLVTLSL
jgi:hypothetical protein